MIHIHFEFHWLLLAMPTVLLEQKFNGEQEHYNMFSNNLYAMTVYIEICMHIKATVVANAFSVQHFKKLLQWFKRV